MTLAPFTNEFPWPAPAKLNLFLHVTARRVDGYHDLQTLFQFLDHGDSLFFVPRGDGKVVRQNALPGIAPEDDLAVRAAKLLGKLSGAGLGADIRIEKRLPIGGGLGGGSSNAATTLVALNRLWNTGFTTAELAEIGLKLGADVPVFVRGLASWAEGVGERLAPVEMPEPWYLVVVPEVSVSTREIFEATELKRDCPRVTLDDYLAGRTVNVCEPVTTARYPEVGQALEWGRQQGPARMSGTGASVYVTFTERALASQAQKRVPAQWKSFVARGLNRSPLTAIMRGL
ncbi:4-(cytidine 5'-diphospho)-2-C-methyl-D-erythritol kinase [Solimonas sp. K1W22B-7]|uniref:4-(cytidine 5'-diphospho)-2-C-methyl-D-erythritol kinase n=1 Tax=Solimonas sp. K1W22B-7 TaxID=2303331 RepID=UPI000E33580B|nr:4-(cytidine 5'-diphospho)-2-C-methyl-D-erythritol kinase [Solimonas sp. K1W22B-7]AXQ28600.1 4-(cytidine 5'-diphospho)-2-C-methyl-D-erythritol kinase [Solimonas sp. K1W22B-7]